MASGFTPAMEQQLIEEVHYLHRLWWQGPPPGPGQTRRPPTPPTAGPDWPCNPLPPTDNPAATTWDTIKTSARATSARPPTDDELSWLSASQTQKEAVQFCRDYFAEEEEEYDDDDDEDMETEFFEFFAGTLEKVGDLAELYKKRWEQGEFVCLVCAGTGVKVWRKFANLVALVQHSLTISCSTSAGPSATLLPGTPLVFPASKFHCRMIRRPGMKKNRVLSLRYESGEMEDMGKGTVSSPSPSGLPRKKWSRLPIKKSSHSRPAKTPASNHRRFVPPPTDRTRKTMAGVGPLTQDWEPVVIRKKAPTAAAKKDEKAVNAARRSGAEIETVKKHNAATNKAASSSTSLNTKKLDDETENLTHERVSMELKKNIMQARMDKKLTQAQLAQLINEKPQVIQEYESGKAIPNQQVINKLERILGVKLRGKK